MDLTRVKAFPAPSRPWSTSANSPATRVRVAPEMMISVKTPNTHAVARAKPGDTVRLRWAAADAYLVPSD